MDPSDSDPARRFLPDEPFPAYSFVPGRSPHPESDPAGHSFGRQRVPTLPLDPANWRENRTYLRGLDLFNAGFFWESHVEFESLWIAAGRRGVVADFLKGLIHLAAAGVKHLEGRPTGVKSHARRAAVLWQRVMQASVEEPTSFCDLELSELKCLAESISEHGWQHIQLQER